MRRGISGCSEGLRAAALVLLIGSAAQAQTAAPRRADAGCTAQAPATLASEASSPGAAAYPGTGSDCWVGFRFEVGSEQLGDRSLYLPYLYGGGDIYLNGALVRHVPTSTPGRTVRWERPFLLPLPPGMLRPGFNELVLRVASEPVSGRAIAPPLTVGAADTVADRYETRLFRVRTMSQVTAISAWTVGVMAVGIWWRRREEVPYGLFGIASLLWGVRTLNLVVESLPAAGWEAWRLLYLWSTGGFAIALLLFELRVARLHWRRFERAAIVYGLACPVLYAFSIHDDRLVGKLWSGGLLPLSLIGVLVLLRAACKEPSIEIVALAGVVALTFVAGMHDYLVHAASPMLAFIWPEAAVDRLFLLQYAADLLLVLMGGLLSARFVRTLGELATLNRTLEARVAEREAVLTGKFQLIGALERRHAADEERQRLLRDLHDGLGSRLFVTLSQVEANAISGSDIAQALRECIADMRLTFEATTLGDGDFLTAWSNFRFRWERQLQAVGIESRWRTEPEDATVTLGAEAALQLLRIGQEALTNVLKHARASRVDIRLDVTPAALRIEVADDGLGLPAAMNLGRGTQNMRARASAVGAPLDIVPTPGGTGTTVRVALRLGQRDLQPA